MKSLVLFITGAIAFGALSLAGGYAWWDMDALIQGGAAFGLAFVPAAGTLAWVLHTYRTTPQLQLMASLGGSGLRMAIALGGGLLLTSELPHMFHTPFWGWLAWFYLVLLAFEITVLARQLPKLNGAGPA
jgi:hypothetical protein